MKAFNTTPPTLEELIEFCENYLPLFVNGYDNQLEHLTNVLRRNRGKENWEQIFAENVKVVHEMCIVNFQTSMSTLESSKILDLSHFVQIRENFSNTYIFRALSLTNKSFVKRGSLRRGDEDLGILRDRYIQHILICVIILSIFGLPIEYILSVIFHDNKEDCSNKDINYYWTNWRIKKAIGSSLADSVDDMSIPQSAKDLYLKKKNIYPNTFKVRRYFYMKNVQRVQIEKRLETDSIAGNMALWNSFANTFANLFDDFRKVGISQEIVERPSWLIRHYENQIQFFKKHDLHPFGVELCQHFLNELQNSFNSLRLEWSSESQDILNSTLDFDKIDVA